MTVPDPCEDTEPEPHPDGWEPFTDWACECPFYLPSREAMPAAPTWVDCKGTTYPCQAMATDWNHGSSPISLRLAFWTDEAGESYYGFRRNVGRKPVVLLVRVSDGTIVNAILNQWSSLPNYPGCMFTDIHIEGGKYLIGVQGGSRTDSFASPRAFGALGGDLGAPPRLVWRDVVPHELVGSVRHPIWRLSESLVLREGGGGIEARGWGEVSGQPVAKGSEFPGLQIGPDWIVRGSTVVFMTSRLNRAGLHIWTAPGPSEPLQHWSDAERKDAANPGSDGKDLVWSYGEGRKDEGGWEKRFVMTAPWVDDASLLAPRKVAEIHGKGLGSGEWKVGCGYGVFGGGGKELMLVRLEDGASWFIGEEGNVRPSEALGVTCSEVFALALVDGEFTLIRVPIKGLSDALP